MRYYLESPIIQCTLLMFTVFIIDLVIPLGVAVGVLYVCCIALLIREKVKVTLRFSVLATLLTAIIPVITFDDRTTWMAFVNRGISLLAVWMIYFIVVKHRILDHKMRVYTTKLEIKNKELEQFNYVASHDLQEPLNTINSFSLLLNKQYKGAIDEKADKYLDFITQASNRMSALVKALLDYGRIGHNLNLEKVDCNLVLEDVRSDIDALITKTNTQLLINDLPKIKGYETELRLLFQNLISNAIKFQGENTTPVIKIGATLETNQWIFFVKDNGIGIEQKYKERIFAIFQRLHPACEFEGTGIGLAHCRKIVDLHGGNIWLDSHLNQGTTFYFNIPA
ncbi:ATP-binding protein [Flammeovirga sp. SJP92]|uniref:sensor histidine kinase n=1 Tax=Flammeovirga sp. SJP92 TaxID=1775430 RepID=UPI0009EE5B85|nr:ATP-binding protein [Flammeovirga sp. SJP92]